MRSGTLRYDRLLAWNTQDMWAWVIAAPAGFMLLIFVLAWLEETVVFPVDRAVRIAEAIEKAPPEEIELLIARMLAPVAPARRVS